MKQMLVDSDVLIDVLRQVPMGTEALANAKAQASLAVSVISRMEMTVGSFNREALLRTERLLRQFNILLLSAEISRVADDLITQYYLSHKLLIPDALIAATALVHQLPLLSKNQRDYRFIPGLQLLPYPTT